MIPRRPRPSERRAAALLAVAALLLASCGGGDEKTADGTGDTAAPAPSPTAAPGPARRRAGPQPSEYAKRELGPKLLRLYRQTGASVGLDWSVIAAVDQVDLRSGDPGIPARERVPGIGYTLAATGAPHDYRLALFRRAGGPYADRVLTLAERLREPPRPAGEQPEEVTTPPRR